LARLFSWVKDHVLRVRKAKGWLDRVLPQTEIHRATYVWPSSAHSVVNLGWRILSFPIRLYANGEEMQKATLEPVGGEA